MYRLPMGMKSARDETNAMMLKNKSNDNARQSYGPAIWVGDRPLCTERKNAYANGIQSVQGLIVCPCCACFLAPKFNRYSAPSPKNLKLVSNKTKNAYSFTTNPKLKQCSKNTGMHFSPTPSNFKNRRTINV